MWSEKYGRWFLFWTSTEILSPDDSADNTSVRTILFDEDIFVISKEEGSIQRHTGEVQDIVDSVSHDAMRGGGGGGTYLKFFFLTATNLGFWNTPM